MRYFNRNKILEIDSPASPAPFCSIAATRVPAHINTPISVTHVPIMALLVIVVQPLPAFQSHLMPYKTGVPSLGCSLVRISMGTALKNKKPAMHRPSLWIIFYSIHQTVSRNQKSYWGLIYRIWLSPRVVLNFFYPPFWLSRPGNSNTSPSSALTPSNVVTHPLFFATIQRPSVKWKSEYLLFCNVASDSDICHSKLFFLKGEQHNTLSTQTATRFIKYCGSMLRKRCVGGLSNKSLECGLWFDFSVRENFKWLWPTGNWMKPRVECSENLQRTDSVEEKSRKSLALVPKIALM